MLKTPHRFYQWSHRKQNMFIIGCGLAILAIILFSFGGLLLGWFWTILLYPTFFIFAQMMDTPLGQRKGRLLYFSPLFIVEKSKNDEFILHGGTLFDMLFVFRWQDRGEPARRQTTAEFLTGMLAFANYLEAHNLQETTIKGSSYFFSERNAQRYGFTVTPLDEGQKIILSMNYLVILLTYSFTHGKLARPPLGRMKSVESTGVNLIAHRDKLHKTVTRLQQPTSIL